MLNILYIIVNTLYIIINNLFTIINYFYIVISNLYTIINKFLQKLISKINMKLNTKNFCPRSLKNVGNNEAHFVKKM